MGLLACVAAGASSSLSSGEHLRPQEYLLSPSGEFRLTFQANGRISLHRGDEVLWEPWDVDLSRDAAPERLELLEHGDLVARSCDGVRFWSSDTDDVGAPPFTLALHDTGDLILSDAHGVVLFARGGRHVELPRGREAPVLGPGQALLPGQSVRSANREFFLAYQGDANVVLYNNRCRALWSSDTYHDSDPGRLVMREDGNLVAYDRKGESYWSTRTSGEGEAPRQLVLEDGGRLVIMDARGRVLWSANREEVEDGFICEEEDTD